MTAKTILYKNSVVNVFRRVNVITEMYLNNQSCAEAKP